MDLSVVFPCLNEAETLAGCIAEALAALAGSGIDAEIVVADNGSTDGSPEIARAHGARVVDVPRRGYGAALKGGVAAARGRYVVFADADGSYRLADIPALYRTAVETGADMVVARRLGGDIEPGAMPALHRYLGTPVLTWLINRLFGGRLGDCNSGFRCVRKTAYETWGVRADGMEFASELLIRALKSGSRVVECASGLRRDRRSRPPHLRTWRDGMRHLLFILSEKPQLFEQAGLALIVIASVLQLLALAVGPVKVLFFHVFDYHSQALLIPLAATGTQLYLFSCVLYLSGGERPLPVTGRVLGLDEAHLFFILVVMVLAEVAGLLFVVWRWSLASFANFDMIRVILGVTHFLCVVGFAGVGLLGIHVFRSRHTPRVAESATAAAPKAPPG